MDSLLFCLGICALILIWAEVAALCGKECGNYIALVTSFIVLIMVSISIVINDNYIDSPEYAKYEARIASEKARVAAAKAETLANKALSMENKQE